MKFEYELINKEKTTMKTLKQQFTETWEKDHGYTSNTNWHTEIKAVRKWLEQKRQEWMRLENNDPIQTNLIFSELLEELKQ